MVELDNSVFTVLRKEGGLELRMLQLLTAKFFYGDSSRMPGNTKIAVHMVK